MQFRGNRGRENFIHSNNITLCNSVITVLDHVLLFEWIYPGDFCFTFNAMKGSKHMECVTVFSLLLREMTSGVEHMKGQWSGELSELLNVRGRSVSETGAYVGREVAYSTMRT